MGNDFSNDYGLGQTQGDNAPKAQNYSNDYGLTPTNATEPTIPKDVRNASEVTGSHDFDGLCEKFVEEMAYGKSGMYPTAVSAWNDYANNGKAYQGLSSAKPGDAIYFGPDASNQNAGHAAIYEGNGKMISATSLGVREDDVNQWMQDTGQQLLGFIPQQ